MEQRLSRTGETVAELRPAPLRLEDILVFLGPNPEAYLRDRRSGDRFALIRGFGWPAFLGDVGWLVHRKLYAEAGALWLLMLVALAVSPDAWPVALAAKLVLGLWGRRYYMGVAERRAAAIIARESAGRERCDALAAAGGIGPGGWLVGLSMQATVAFAALWGADTPAPHACDDAQVQQAIVNLARNRLRVESRDYFRIRLTAIWQLPGSDSEGNVCRAQLAVGDSANRGPVQYVVPAGWLPDQLDRITFVPTFDAPRAFDDLVEPGPDVDFMRRWWVVIAIAGLGVGLEGAMLFLIARAFRLRWSADAVLTAAAAGVLSIPVATVLAVIPHSADPYVPDGWQAFWTSFFDAALAEEAAKLYVLARFVIPASAPQTTQNSRARWILSASLIGIGFEVVESLEYALYASTATEALEQIIGRAALPVHAALGALLGAVCWSYRYRRLIGATLWWLPALSCAIVSHTLVDLPLLSLLHIDAPFGLTIARPEYLEWAALGIVAAVLGGGYALASYTDRDGDTPLGPGDALPLGGVVTVVALQIAWMCAPASLSLAGLLPPGDNHTPLALGGIAGAALIGSTAIALRRRARRAKRLPIRQ